MFKPLFTFIICAFALIVSGAAMPAFADSTVTTRLPNGLTVLIRPDQRFPLVSLRLYVRAGSSYESAAEAGISHVLEHMVFKGTQQRPKGEVAENIEKAGGYLNAATSFDYTVYITDMPDDQWKLGMDVLKDMAFAPTLAPEELQSEQQVIVAELQRGKDSPSSRLFERIQGAAFDGTAYSHPIIGYEHTITAFTSEDIRSYINRHYQPQSMFLVVTGNVDAQEALDEARRLFGKLENTRDVPIRRALPVPQPAPAVMLEEGAWNKTYLMLALPVPGFADADSPALDVLAHLLGGDPTSLLYRTYKYERGIVDEIYAANYSFEQTGLFLIGAHLDAAKVPEFLDSLAKDLAQVSADSFTPQEYARARLILEDDMLRAKETLPGLASKIGYFLVFGQDEDRYLSDIANSGPAQVQNAIDRWLNPQHRLLAVLAPEGSGLDADSLGSALDSSWQATHSATPEENTQAENQAETVILGPGRTVLLLPDTTLPYTSVDLTFTGGAYLLNPQQQGLAALTAEVLTSGTATATAPQLESFKADRAAVLSAAAGRQTFTLSARQPSRFDTDMFSLLAETVNSPAFHPEEITREKENQAAAILAAEDQPLGLAFRHLTTWLFPTHPYGYLQLGTPESIASFTRDDICNYWTAQAQQSWVLAVCGNFDRQAVLELAASLPVPTAQRPTPPPPAWTDQPEKILSLADRNQAHMLLIYPTVGRNHPDSPSLELLQEVLAGQSGLLFRDLRDVHGLAYTVTAWNWQAAEAGFMAFYIGTEPAKLDAAEQGFMRIIDSLRNTPLGENELERGKNQMNGNYYREHQRLGSRSNEAATLTALGYGKDFGRELILRANSLTAEHLRHIAEKYLLPAHAMKMLVMP